MTGDSGAQHPIVGNVRLGRSAWELSSTDTMLLFELLQPTAGQIHQDPVLVPTGSRKQPCLLHDFVILNVKSTLLLPPNVVAKRSVEIGILCFATTLERRRIWLLISS